MENKKLLIGAGVVVVAYLFWKKSQSNSVANSNVIMPQYSKECYDELQIRLQQKDVKEPDFEKTFLEKCEKTKNKIQKDSLGQPKVQRTMGLGMGILEGESDWSILGKIPNEFTVKSNGFNTRYYKNIDKTLTGFASTFSVPDVYKQPYSTTGMSGVMPTKISVREFSDAYSVFLQQPK
jgi:hypothetical protein